MIWDAVALAFLALLVWVIIEIGMNGNRSSNLNNLPKAPISPSQIIRQRMKTAGATKAQMAKAIERADKISKQQVYNFLSDRHDCSATAFLMMARLLGGRITWTDRATKTKVAQALDGAAPQPYKQPDAI